MRGCYRNVLVTVARSATLAAMTKRREQCDETAGFISRDGIHGCDIGGGRSGCDHTSVNFRSGPGTGYASLGKITEGAKVDVSECDASGAWCAVTLDGRKGFVSGKYVEQADPQKPNWPRSFTTGNGATLTLFQPQITGWPDFTTLNALIATELKATAQAKPIYGVIGVSGRTMADDATDEVVLTDVTATQVDFSTLDRKELTDLAIEVGKIMPAGPITLSQERLTASLADYQRLADVNGIKSDPPHIAVSTDPAILVQTDGKAVLSPVKGVEGLQFVVNTNWDIFKTADPDGAYVLRDEKSWLTSKTLDGTWEAAVQLPAILSQLPDDESWKDAKAAMPAAPFEGGKVPRVIYSALPAEMVLFDGQPALEAVPGTGLEWASNTTSDAFFHKASKTWYVLLSGRWFPQPAWMDPGHSQRRAFLPISRTFPTTRPIIRCGLPFRAPPKVPKPV